jgi:hypothetical protein
MGYKSHIKALSKGYRFLLFQVEGGEKSWENVKSLELAGMFAREQIL